MNKKRRKIIKKTRLRNKKLIKKYPWLIPKNVWSGEVVDNFNYEYTLLDDIPIGWRKSFGLMMIEEMDKARCKCDIYTQQIKEKFGELRWYCNSNKEVNNVIDKYSLLSSNICIHCGKPDVHMTLCGWIYPCCEDCWNKNEYNKTPYNEAIDDENDNLMEEKYSYRQYTKSEYVDVEVDISDTVKKIRNRWYKYERKKNQRKKVNGE